MKATSVFDCRTIDISKIGTGGGAISFLQNDKSIPFSIKRVYYTYDVPGGTERGSHAHRALHQVIVAASGSFTISLDDGNLKREVFLSRPHVGLYVPSGLWRTIENFSNGSTCLVLASDLYTEEDYIRSYDEFLIYKNESRGL